MSEFTTEVKKTLPDAKGENIKAIFDEADADKGGSLNLEEFKSSIEITKRKEAEAAA